MTPIYFQMKGRLDEAFVRLDREKITHWLLNFKRGVNIDDCRGGRITVGGDLEFSGSVRDVYWSFMKPCVEDVIRSTLTEAEGMGRGYSHAVTRAGLDEVGGLLKIFVERVYNRMADVDRRLRGRGYPDKVEPYNPSAHIAELNRVIEDHVACIRTQYPSGMRSVVRYCEGHPVLVGSVLVPIALALLYVIF